MDPQILNLLKEFGAPYLLLGLLSLAVWRVLTWFGNKVVTPMVDSHTGLIAQLQSTDKKQSELLESNTKTQEQILGTQREIVEIMRDKERGIR